MPSNAPIWYFPFIESSYALISKLDLSGAEKSAEGKETGDYTLSVTGNDVKSMTQSLVAESVSISAPDRSSFDIRHKRIR